MLADAAAAEAWPALPSAQQRAFTRGLREKPGIGRATATNTGSRMLDKVLAPRADAAYVALRVVAGLAFAFHGVQKIFGVYSKSPPELGSQLWVGGLIELVCGVAVAVGFLTVWAAFLSSGTMAVAYTQFHWKLQLGDQFWPAVNKGELALIYAFLFLYVAARGPGKLSLDGLRLGKPGG